MKSDKLTLLVIEDNPGDVRLIREMLKEASNRPYSIEWADRLSTGLKLLAEQNPDLVLLDPGLPDCQGLETLDRLHDLSPQTPIVIMTGLDDESIGMTAVRRGAQDYLIKGKIDGKVLWRVINYTLERKKIELQLRESEHRYRLLIENTPVGVSIVQSGKIVFTNRHVEKISGYSRDELMSMEAFSLIPPEDNARVRQYYANRMKSGDAPVSYSFRIKNRDGGIRWLDRITLTITWNNKPAVLVIDNDITEHKQAEAKMVEMEALKVIDQAKNDLLANVSHELRTPLASIKGFIETLMETDVKWTRQQQLEFLQSADTEADRLNLLIRDLLDMSRIDSGKMVLDKRSCRIEEILDSASGVLSTIAIKHKLKIEQLPDLPAIQADKVRIVQVITNLVENATKFSPEGSRIEIKTLLNNKEVIISVSDRGIGMPPEVVANLFNRFYQAKQVVSGKSRGSGLGLAICKGIVEAHGGTIRVESQESKGSTFSFSLPI